MMSEQAENNPIYPIIYPKSLAVFGASNRFSAMGSGCLSSILDLGFDGPIYPIHPREETVLGLKAYSSIFETPDVPDLAILVIPSKAVPDTLRECGKRGIRHAIVISGGFKEVGEGGTGLEKKLVEIAGQYGIRFLGPNCIGVANPHHQFNATFLPYHNRPGFIGMVSQSGSFITQMFDYLKRFGLGFSTGISVGNEADIDMVDCIRVLAACPHTKVIGLYIESIRRGRAFIDAARSISVHKPIVAYYVGGSEAGKRAGFSHTGSLAGPDRLYDGVFHQSGVVRAMSMEELFDFCWALGACPSPEGNRIIIQTHSGGPGAAAADAGGRYGLELASLSPETKKQMADYIPHTGTLDNPVDITFSKNPLDYFQNIPEILLGEKEADALLVYFLVPNRSVERGLEQLGVPKDRVSAETAKFIREQCRAVAEMGKKWKKPFIGYSFRSRQELFIQELQDLGVPVFSSPERAARAMGALVHYRKMKEKILTSQKRK
jgi:acyl-CoA synthetase (NDP forming)